MKIGMQELLIVFIVALIVLGPDKLPLYAKKFGEALREFRKFSSEATKDIRESIVEPLEEAQRPLREALEPITELEKEVRGDMEGIQKSFSDIGKPVKKDKGTTDDSSANTPESGAESEEVPKEAAGDAKPEEIPTAGPETEEAKGSQTADADTGEPKDIQADSDTKEPKDIQADSDAEEPKDVRTDANTVGSEEFHADAASKAAAEPGKEALQSETASGPGSVPEVSGEISAERQMA